ncbi:MAG: hypothetical protein P8104_02145 [Gammaproteobacteria bacterium]
MESLETSVFLNPKIIYASMLHMNVFILIALALFPLLAYLRVLLSATDAITRKGVGDAYRDFFMSAYLFILYVFLGSFLFALMPILREGFALFGGAEGVHAVFVDLWERIDQNEQHEVSRGVFMEALSALGAIPGFIGTSVGYALYHLVSVVYRFFLGILEVLLALYIVAQYAMGFIAIPSKLGGRLLDRSEAWFKSTYFLFLFFFFETIILHLVAVLARHTSGNLIDHTAGELWLSRTSWYGYASLYMVLVILGKIIAAIMANSYANGHSAGNAFSAGLATATAAGYALSAKAGKTGMEALPKQGGNRLQDQVARRIADRLRGNA